MEITANSFSLRGESGLVKIVSDSVFDPDGGLPSYASESECDIIVESNGFRVNKVSVLSMPRVSAFLTGLRELVRRGEGSAVLRNDGDELSLAFLIQGGQPRVECAMNDAKEGKENSIQVKYPIEPGYFAVLKRELAKTEKRSDKGA
jgi:hypothetical protein